MNHTAADEYVSALMKGPSENAFHSLIEDGEESISAIRHAISNGCTDCQFKRMIEVLQEMRTTSSHVLLELLCMQPFSKRWIISAEGLFYNDPEGAIEILRRISVDEISIEGANKKEVIDELDESLR